MLGDVVGHGPGSGDGDAVHVHGGGLGACVWHVAGHWCHAPGRSWCPVTATDGQPELLVHSESPVDPSSYMYGLSFQSKARDMKRLLRTIMNFVPNFRLIMH